MSRLRSALFMLWFLATTVPMAILFLPVLVLPRGCAVWLGRSWARVTLWGLRLTAGIGMRVVGDVPRGGVLVAAKHMSMWDTLALYLLLDDPGIVLKRELLPFYGWFLWKAAAIAVDRGGKALGARRMIDSAGKVLAAGRPILIFPEGTRKKPGAAPDYKPGVAGIYTVCWMFLAYRWRWIPGRWGFRKLPGTITLPIPGAYSAGAETRHLHGGTGKPHRKRHGPAAALTRHSH